MGEFPGHKQVINLVFIIAGTCSAFALTIGLVIGLILTGALP